MVFFEGRPWTSSSLHWFREFFIHKMWVKFQSNYSDCSIFNRLKNQMSWGILGVWGQRKRYACSSACTLFNAFLRFPASCSVHFILCLLITSFCLCILNDVDNIWSIFHGAMEDKYPAPMIYLCLIPLMPKWENYG